MPERRWAAVAGSLVFLVLVPGTVAGAIPFWMTGWRVHPPLLGLPASRVVGGVLVLLGLASLVESILRFAVVGLGTPAPVAPPTRLVISGQYRLVRNPMYVAVVAIVLGQALLLDAGGDLNARDDRFDATPAGWAIEYLRARGGLLGMEIDDLLVAIHERDVRWVRRLLTRLPALAGAADRSGKPVAEHARECGSEEIARPFRETRDGPRREEDSGA